MPSLPSNLHDAILKAISKERPKSMPNSFLPASLQGTHHAKEGVILIGDSWNMRHPLTGGKRPVAVFGLAAELVSTDAILGGMTVALSDVVILRDLLKPLISSPVYDKLVESPTDPLEVIAPSQRPLADWSQVASLLSDFHWSRKPLASTVNILSVALYDLFGADGEYI
jgi:squalene monooxygenase